MRREVCNIFGKVFITTEVDEKNRWVRNDWIGYLTKANVIAGALAYLDAVKESGFNCVLNDNSNVLGTWEHSLDWVVGEWEPLAAESGIKHFALIVAPGSMTDSSASVFSSLIKAFEVKVFYNKTDAVKWLHHCSLAEG